MNAIRENVCQFWKPSSERAALLSAQYPLRTCRSQPVAKRVGFSSTSHVSLVPHQLPVRPGCPHRHAATVVTRGSVGAAGAMGGGSYSRKNRPGSGRSVYTCTGPENLAVCEVWASAVSERRHHRVIVPWAILCYKNGPSLVTTCLRVTAIP